MGIRADLLPTVASIIDSVAGDSGLVPCTVYLVRHNTPNSPGQPASSTFDAVLKARAIDLAQKSLLGREEREKHGIDRSELYSCQIALPPTLPTTDLYCYVDSPDTGQQLSGKLVSVDPSDAPLLTISLWVGAAVPLTFADAIALFL